MNREAASGRLFFYRAKVKKRGPALGCGGMYALSIGINCVFLSSSAHGFTASAEIVIPANGVVVFVKG